MKRFFTILHTLALLLSLISNTQAQGVSVDTNPSSSHLVTAEITYISFVFTGLNNYPEPTSIELKEADMFYSHASADRINGQNTYYLHYEFQAVAEGSYDIPSIEFRSAAGIIRSKKVTINVYSKDELKEKSTEINGQALPYYTLIKAAKSSLFPNETTHVEHKIYLPEQLNIALWGLPLGDKKNCSAWRFSTPMRGSTMSRARIDGKTYQAGSFHTNLTSLKQGKASIGPLKGRVVFHAAVMTNRGLINQQFEAQLMSDELAFTVKPLPTGQPEHFRGDVGNYVMSASMDAPSQITSNDSIQAIAQLKGTGNLATVNPPLLLDMEGWKIISQDRTDLGENRKSASGVAEFTYLIQPDPNQTPPTQTPSFLFSLLDPDTGKYDTMRIPSKPITVVAGSSEEIVKAYDGLITELGNFQQPWYKKLPVWLIHILPASFILIFLLKQLRSRYLAHRMANSNRDIKRRALADLEKVDSLFLKSAGAYVERWIDTEKHPKAKEILSLRDSLCFRPESRQDVSAERRKKIISLLRRSSLVLLFTLLSQNSWAQNSSEATGSFEQNNFAESIQAYANLPGSAENPDILYNIGLSHQMAKSPGKAAYFYHKALKINPHHPSALKNLSFIETENDSITSTSRTDLENWIQHFQPTTYLHTIVFLTSIIFCLILTYLYIKPRAIRLRIAIILSIFTPILLALAIYGYISHPDKSTYQLESAVILEQSSLTSQPLATSSVVIEVAPASRCHLIAKRGKFSYVLMANGVKGWLATDMVQLY